MERTPPDVTADSRSISERLEDVLHAARRGEGDDPLEVARARAFEALFGKSQQAWNLGRYVVLERVGAGAMGVVYAAYDPELDRKVAVKVLRGGRHHDHTLAVRRLIREAQALAKLSHPNVVAVHDVGTVDGSIAAEMGTSARPEPSAGATTVPPSDPSEGASAAVFIAMEFVDGDTLRRWFEHTPRSWRDTFDVLVQAGRGLAAAHGAGLVHRDFKPDNVMVGRDARGAERARVMDFGLVRPLDEALAVSLDDSHARPDLDALALPMTRAGAAVGTPMYMAPEQLRGHAADAKSDQFAFCVTAWESLFGVRPYEGRTMLELAANMAMGKRASTPKVRVPTWLRRVFERGLDPDPDRRWPSMEALLAALTRAQRRERVRRWIAIGVTGLAIAGSVVGLDALERARALAACAKQGESIAEVWNDEARERLREGLMATGAGHAATTFEKVATAFDEGADAWQAAREEACVRTDVDRSWEAQVGAQAIECLELQLDRNERLIARIGAGSADAGPWVMKTAGRAWTPASCLDPALLARRMPLPESEPLRSQVIAIGIEMEDGHEAELARDYPRAFAVDQRLLADAEALGYMPLITHIRINAAGHAAVVGALDVSERLAEEGYFEAAMESRDLKMVDAALILASVGRERGRYDEAREWARHAEVSLRRLNDDETAEVAGRVAIELGHVEFARGDFDAAEREFRRGVAIWTSLYGAGAAPLARPLMNLASVERARGDSEASLDATQRALAVMEAALGRDHPQVAELLWTAGDILLSGDRAEEAHAAYERAHEIFVGVVPRVHDNIAKMEVLLAEADIGRDHIDEADQHLRRALEPVPGGPETLATRSIGLVTLSELRSRQGRPAEAQAAVEEALPSLSRIWGTENKAAARAEAALARALSDLGEFSQAMNHVERARATCRTLHLDACVASVELQMADTFWRADGDAAIARALAESAATAFADRGMWKRLAEAQQWLATHEVRR